MIKTWTEAEDFYLTSSIGNKTLEEIAKGLSRTLKQVNSRIKKLNINLEEIELTKQGEQAKLEKERALKGLAVGSATDPTANIVSMTGGRSLNDDAANGIGPSKDPNFKPPTSVSKYLKQFRTKNYTGKEI